MLPVLTVFLGSFLLFLVQPMLGRMLLPAFGGSAAVWVTCLAAYQGLLVIAYLYAHVLAGKSRLIQRIVHLLLLGMAFFWSVVIALGHGLIRGVLGHSAFPSVEVVLAVTVLIGLPYLLLGAGSSLVQSAVSEREGRGVYRLYAVSNFGSFLGLLCYPLMFEPFVGLPMQWWILSVGLLVYTGLMGVLLPKAGEAPVRTEFLPGAKICWRWFLLPAASCFMLNAVTAYLTLDVMAFPLLWVIVLGLFLLSYVIGFSWFSEKMLSVFASLALLFAVGAGVDFGNGTPLFRFIVSLVAGCGFCFFSCVFIHSWLYRLRPEREGLTFYYLANAVGGAAGGCLASLAAPAIFRSVLEFPIALMLAPVLAAWFFCSRFSSVFARTAALLLCAAGLTGSAFQFFPKQGDYPLIYRSRDFFGTFRVFELPSANASGKGSIHEFLHANTVHGLQALIPGMERLPTTYYTPGAGGYGIQGHWKYRGKKPMRVNLVGLGVGVMMAYARPGDFYKGYEISSEVLAIAKDPRLFTFVSGCPATVELRQEDARKGLEAELAAGVEPYDVIVVDAFTGDNIPYHLSTVEAFELYFKMLKPDGILAVNISNWHLELEPFIKALSLHFDWPVMGLHTADNPGRLGFSATFVFFCRAYDRLGPLPKGSGILDFNQGPAMKALPTDEKGSFISLIRF